MSAEKCIFEVICPYCHRLFKGEKEYHDHGFECWVDTFGEKYASLFWRTLCINIHDDNTQINFNHKTRDYVDHLCSDFGIRPFKCSKCHKKYSRLRGFKDHLKRKNGKKSVCERSSTRKTEIGCGNESLKCGIRLITTLKELEDAIEKKLIAVPEPGDYSYETSSNHPGKPYKCNHCNERFQGIAQATGHVGQCNNYTKNRDDVNCQSNKSKKKTIKNRNTTNDPSYNSSKHGRKWSNTKNSISKKKSKSLRHGDGNEKKGREKNSTRDKNNSGDSDGENSESDSDDCSCSESDEFDNDSDDISSTPNDTFISARSRSSDIQSDLDSNDGSHHNLSGRSLENTSRKQETKKSKKFHRINKNKNKNEKRRNLKKGKNKRKIGKKISNKFVNDGNDEDDEKFDSGVTPSANDDDHSDCDRDNKCSGVDHCKSATKRREQNEMNKYNDRCPWQNNKSNKLNSGATKKEKEKMMQRKDIHDDKSGVKNAELTDSDDDLDDDENIASIGTGENKNCNQSDDMTSSMEESNYGKRNKSNECGDSTKHTNEIHLKTQNKNVKKEKNKVVTVDNTTISYNKMPVENDMTCSVDDSNINGDDESMIESKEKHTRNRGDTLKASVSLTPKMCTNEDNSLHNIKFGHNRSYMGKNTIKLTNDDDDLNINVNKMKNGNEITSLRLSMLSSQIGINAKQTKLSNNKMRNLRSELRNKSNSNDINYNIWNESGDKQNKQHKKNDKYRDQNTNSTDKVIDSDNIDGSYVIQLRIIRIISG